MASYRSLARNRDFTILWTGETVSQLGTYLSLFAFPLVAYAISGSALVAAVVEAAYLLGEVGSLLPAGVIADRVDRKRVMLTASAVGSVGYASLAVTGILGMLTVPHLIAVAVITGICGGVFGPAQLSAIRTVVSDEELPTAMSQNQARQHVASLVGGPLGGLLYSVARWLPFAVDAVTFAISCFTVSRLRADLSPAPRTDAGDGATGSTRLRTDLVEGLRFIWVRPFFRSLAFWSAGSNLVINALFFVTLLVMISSGAHPTSIGLVSTAAGVGGLLGALLAPALIERMRTGALTALVAWTAVLVTVPLIWLHSPLAVGISLFALLLTNPAGNAGIGAYRVAVTPDDLQGRVGSSSQFLSMAMMPLAPLAGGLLLEHLGNATAIATMVAAVGALAVFVTLNRSFRAVPKPAQWRADLAAAEDQVSAGI